MALSSCFLKIIIARDIYFFLSLHVATNHTQQLYWTHSNIQRRPFFKTYRGVLNFWNLLFQTVLCVYFYSNVWKCSFRGLKLKKSFTVNFFYKQNYINFMQLKAHGHSHEPFHSLLDTHAVFDFSVYFSLWNQLCRTETIRPRSNAIFTSGSLLCQGDTVPVLQPLPCFSGDCNLSVVMRQKKKPCANNGSEEEETDDDIKYPPQKSKPNFWEKNHLNFKLSSWEALNINITFTNILIISL